MRVLVLVEAWEWQAPVALIAATSFIRITGQATEGGEPGGPSVAGHALPSSVIIAERRGQSQKPEELYEYVGEICIG